ncbi:hypothetical protein FOCC_FOCC012802 [Frankliniella occidentalis]|nr:hypothetical protein FOCC_FOCC012802 [Frankliniella occidentalis]
MAAAEAAAAKAAAAAAAAAGTSDSKAAEEVDDPDPGEAPPSPQPLATRFGNNYIDIGDDYFTYRYRYLYSSITFDFPQGSKSFPKLWRIARRFLGITASSAPTERVWSKTGLIVTPRRSTISPSMITVRSLSDHFYFVDMPNCYILITERMQ